MQSKLLAGSIIALTLYIVTIAAAEWSQVSFTSSTSTSPYNPGIWGSSEYVKLLSSSGYRVFFGGPLDALRMSRQAPTLYIVLAPDREFTKTEALAVYKGVESGRLNVIVADELGVANSLLKVLGAPRVKGSILEQNGSLIVAVNCEGYVTLVPKVSYLVGVDGWRVVCTSSGKPVAALGTTGAGSRILVVADSSIYANFMVKGIPPYTSTVRLALYLTRLAAGDAKNVVVDVEHYVEMRVPGPLARLIGLSLWVLDSLISFTSHLLRHTPPWLTAVTVLIVALFLAAIVREKS